MKYMHLYYIVTSLFLYNAGTQGLHSPCKIIEDPPEQGSDVPALAWWASQDPIKMFGGRAMMHDAWRQCTQWFSPHSTGCLGDVWHISPRLCACMHTLFDIDILIVYYTAIVCMFAVYLVFQCLIHPPPLQVEALGPAAMRERHGSQEESPLPPASL